MFYCLNYDDRTNSWSSLDATRGNILIDEMGNFKSEDHGDRAIQTEMHNK